MKTLIVYDSDNGNTKLIAEEIAKELSPDSKAVRVNDVHTTDLEQAEFIITGSSLNNGRLSQNILWFIYRLNSIGRKGIKAAAFDTKVRSFFGGNGAKVMAKALSDRGFKIVDTPQEFYLKGKEGPLLEGEIERAALWAKQLLSPMNIA